MTNTNIYFKSVLEKNIYINLNNINSNLEKNILTILRENFEGKCSNDGYIKNDSINILTYSSGLITSDNIKFNVAFECLICYPVDGMTIQCVVKNITKAGLKCELNEENSPLIIFVARDHHYKNSDFNNVTENDIINVKIIGQRFELNDPYICVISEYLEKSEINTTTIDKNSKQSKSKKKLKLIE
jgi:DNA-directed RNA polymerase subunit E'/Rpb7